MPEQAPRKLVSACWPIALLIAIATLLALPIIGELLTSIVHTQSESENSRSIISDLIPSSHRFQLLIRSLLTAGFIGFISITLGIPLGRLIASARSRRHRILVAFFITPIWLPAAMVYTAGNLLRAPDTLIGNAIISYSTSSDDLRWVTIWIGYAIAIFGLSLWAAPISALLIASGLGSRSNLYDEMLAIEPIGLIRRAFIWIRIHRSILIRSWILISILMLGSAVPLHLAQLETWSIVIWRDLAESAPNQWGSVWISSYPVLIAGCIGAWVLTKYLIKPTDELRYEDRGNTQATSNRKTVFSAGIVWGLGTLIPLLAMLITLDDLGSIIHFWRVQFQAVQDSSVIALAAGASTLLIALLVSINLGSPSSITRKITAICVFLLCILGLIPGILIGAAIARSSYFGIADGFSGALLAGMIRSAFLGAIIGCLCASSESNERKSIRWQLAGPSVIGWIRTVLPSVGLPILGSGLIGALYAFYEIEASIMVRPPSMQNLPQQLLSDMHYARLEQLSAAGVNLILIGIICSFISALLIGKIHTD